MPIIWLNLVQPFRYHDVPSKPNTSTNAVGAEEKIASEGGPPCSVRAPFLALSSLRKTLLD